MSQVKQTKRFCSCGDELIRGDALCHHCWSTIRDNWRDQAKANKAEVERLRKGLQSLRKLSARIHSGPQDGISIHAFQKAVTDVLNGVE